jgi:hypothetical protein
MSDVSKPSSAVTEMSEDWALVGALLGGTRAMRTAGKKFLPQWPNEPDKTWEFRRDTAVLFPALKRTVETLTGKPFSKPITRGDDIPPEIADFLEDVDLQGRNIDVFGAEAMEVALGYGLGGILVDYPDASNVERTAAGEVTREAEKKAGLRPYFVLIKPAQLLGWRAKVVGGVWQLLQLRFMECVEEPDGAFGTKEAQQVRVLEPGTWATYRKDPAKPENWIPYKNGTTTLDIIPFVPFYGNRTGFMCARPPLVELAHMNVKHWQSQSDQDTILHIARVPILAAIGIDDDKWEMTVGASSAVKLPTGADMKYVEHGGKAIDAGKVSLDDLKEEMRQAGAELLVIQPGTVTATQVAMENAVGMCALQRITQSLEDALDQALQIMAKWLKLPEGGHVTIFNDYGAATLAEASAELLLKTNQAGKLSDETLLNEYKRRGILAAEVDPTDEAERISTQGPVLGAIPPAVPGMPPAGTTMTPPANGNA